MRRQTSFSTSSIFRAMGVRSPQQIPLESGAATPTVQIADFSTTYAPEQIEARAVCNMEANSTAPHTYLTFAVHARSEGGLVVEHLALDLTPGAAFFFVGFLDALPAGVWSPMTGSQLWQCGGLPLRSVGYWIRNVSPGAGDFLSGTDQFTMPTDRLYVQPGKYFVWGGFHTAAFSITGAVAFREIPEILGGP